MVTSLTYAVVARISMYEALEIAHPLVSLVAASGARRRHGFFKEKISVEEVSIKKVKTEKIFTTPTCFYKKTVAQ
jgi:hypothetical protein